MSLTTSALVTTDNAYLMPFEISIELRVVVKEAFREMLELLRHGDPVGEEVLLEALHQGAEADVGVALVIHRHQQRRQQVGHSLKLIQVVVSLLVPKKTILHQQSSGPLLP